MTTVHVETRAIAGLDRMVRVGRCPREQKPGAENGDRTRLAALTQPTRSGSWGGSDGLFSGKPLIMREWLLASSSCHCEQERIWAARNAAVDPGGPAKVACQHTELADTLADRRLSSTATCMFLFGPDGCSASRDDRFCGKDV